VQRWVPRWDGLWMVFARRGIEIDRYPAVRAHLERFREKLEPRPEAWDEKRDGKWPGRKPGPYEWYEIQDTVAYWELLESPKILYPDIMWRPDFCLDVKGRYSNNTVYFLPSGDPWLLAVLNSPIGWWFSWRSAAHGKDDALRFFNTFVEGFPVVTPEQPAREQGSELVELVTALRSEGAEQVRALLDWLRVEHGIEKPGRRLEATFDLTSDELVAEVRKRRGKKGLSAAALKSLREEHAATVEPMRRRLAEGEELERRLADLVHQAYGLTPEEVDLMWRTAPPRMPVAGPVGDG